jgi:hypothetical protein
MPRERRPGFRLNHVNSLCTCVIGECSQVFSFKTCLSHKGLVGNWLSIYYQFPNTLLKGYGYFVIIICENVFFREVR